MYYTVLLLYYCPVATRRVQYRKLGWSQSASTNEVELNTELDLTNQLMPLFLNLCHFLQLMPFLDISTNLIERKCDFVVPKKLNEVTFHKCTHIAFWKFPSIKHEKRQSLELLPLYPLCVL